MGLRNLKLGQRNRIISEFYEANIARGKAFTVQHFMGNHGLKRTAIYDALERIDRIRAGGRAGRLETLDRRPGSGRPRKLSNRQAANVLRILENKKGASTQTQARRFGVHRTTIQRVMRRQGAKAPKRQKAPEIDATKMQRVVERSAILSRDYFPEDGRTAMIIDDESFFTLKGDEMRGNDRVWTRDITTCPPEVRFRQKSKFPKKLLVHAVISQRACPSSASWKAATPSTGTTTSPSSSAQLSRSFALIIGTEITGYGWT